MLEGIAEETGIILNDSISNSSYCDTPLCPSTFFMEGKRIGKLMVKPYKTGFTIKDECPNHPMYYTITAPPVIKATDVLTHIWSNQICEFIYGIVDRRHLNTDCMYYFIKRQDMALNYYSTLTVKTSPSAGNPNIIRYEFLWNDGEIYTIDYQLSNLAVTITDWVKIEKSILPDFLL